MLAYGVDMEMTQSGKVTPLVELMASVFFGCGFLIPFVTTAAI